MEKGSQDNARGTGRTTRMLLNALIANRYGAPLVVIVGWHYQDCMMMMNMMMDLPALRGPLVKINFTQLELTVGTGRIAFRVGNSDDFDWRSKRFKYMDNRTPVFVDHYAEEMHAEEESRRAIDAARAARLAEAREEDKARARVLQGSVARDTTMAHSGAQETISTDVSGDAPSSCSWSESSGGSCGTD